MPEPSVAERIQKLPADRLAGELLWSLAVLDAIAADDNMCDGSVECSHCFAGMQRMVILNRLLGGESLFDIPDDGNV